MHIEDRDEFIKLYNSGYFGYETTLSDDLVREYFPMLPIHEWFVGGCLSNDIVNEFKDDLIYMVGPIPFKSIPKIINLLTKYELTFIHHKASDGGMYINTEYEGFYFTFSINKRTYMRFNRNKDSEFKMKTCLLHELNEREIIGNINKVLFKHKKK